MDSKQNVLVFGPTGAVGSATSIEAHRRGANVWLAMRDTSKSIEGLSQSDLESKRYTRVQADLTKPDTLKHAVQKSGAISAFVYAVLGSEDNMRSVFDALRDAGISYVVLLSSYSVKGPADDQQNMKHFLTRRHAEIEIALKESGLLYTAVRPMFFTSNLSWYTEGIRQGTVQVFYPDVKFDYISPTDIGAVCGTLLSEPHIRPKENGFIPLCGPQLHTQREALGIMGQILGREITIQELDEDAWYEQQLKHMPRPIVDSLTSTLKASHQGHDSYADFAEMNTNISKYAEREPTKLTDWIKANRTAFE